MKDFDLAAAKRGATVCTRDGNPVRILCFNLKYDGYPIVAAIDRHAQDEGEFIETYTTDGKAIYGSIDHNDLMMADDDYLEKLERGEYDHIEDNLEMVGKPDHIGEATEKVHDPRSLGNEWLNDMIKARSSIFKDLERSLDIERRKYELSKLKHETEMLELERIPENWDYWRRMYAGMAMQGLCVAHGTKNSAEHIARGAVERADAIIEELKKEKK